MSTKPDPKLKGVAIADTSIKQPVFITMVMLLLIVLGLMSYASMPVNLYPDFEVPVVAVQLIYPGASPDSVADQVTEPVEDTLISISGVKNITSQSFEGANLITIEFETGVDIDVAEQDVRSKVNAIIPRLPREVEDPLFFKFDPGEIPVISLAISGTGERSSVELRKLVEDDIVPFLQRVPGVGSVTVSGGQERQINVLLDLDKIQARRIPPSIITRAIEQANVNLGLGTLEAGSQEISLRAPSMIQDPQDIANIQITGTSYRIGDVASVEDGIAEIQTYARINGEEVIRVSIIKRPDANVVDVAHQIREELGEIFSQYPDVQYTIPLDTSTFVEESVHGAIEELIVASLAAMIIVFVFFRNLRNTLVTIIGLPVILIATFAAITLFGLTINVITLMGLSLSVGLVIDDAIVVRENIFRHTEMGKPPIIASSQGTAEVSLSVVAMTLTIIAVFVPVTFTTGVPGVIFKSFGITVACAMAISLFEAFTLAPMTSAHLFKEDAKQRERRERKEREAQERQRAMRQDGTSKPAEDEARDEDVDLTELESEHVDWMGRVYGFLLRWSLRFRWAILLIAVAIFIASFYVATGLQFAFFPESDQGEFYLGFELQPGAPLEETNKLALETETILMQDPMIDMVLSTVGGGGSSGFGGGGGGSSERAEIFVKLKEDHPPTREVMKRLRSELSFLPKLALGVESMGGNGSNVTGRDIQLEINTNRPVEELIPFLLQLQAGASEMEGVVDVGTSYTPGRPELKILADPARIGDLGITNDDIAASVRTLINGSKAGVFRKDGEDVDIQVRLQPGDRASVEDIRNISVPTLSGNRPIGSIVEVELAAGPTTIRRQNRVNQIIVGANVVDRNVNEVIQEMTTKLEHIEVPQGVEIGFGGDTEDQTEGFATMLIAMGLSILFVYMVLASEFGSFFQPIVIMLAMPFSFLGSFLALRMVGFALDIISMIGLVMLMGLVVKNSILLVDFTNRLRRAGLSKHDALEKAGMVRLRPILMTSMALIAGALPVAIGLGEGAEIRQGLSIVVIGGMITSTLLTLLVVPTAYSVLEGIVDLSGRFFRGISGGIGRVFRRGTPDSRASRDGTRDTELQPVPASHTSPTAQEDGGRAGTGKGASTGEGATVAYATTGSGEEPRESFSTSNRKPSR